MSRLRACWATLWGSRTRPRLLISVFQAADSYWLIKPPRTGRRQILPWTGSGTGASERGGRSMQRSMRPLCVVVHRIPGKHAAQVSFPEDQHSVGEFGL
jgi:hypothetical protein